MSRSPTSKRGRRQHRGVQPKKTGGTLWMRRTGWQDGWQIAGRFKDLIIDYEKRLMPAWGDDDEK